MNEKSPLVSPHGTGNEISPGWLRRDHRYHSCFPARYVLAVMSGLGFAILYGLRVTLSVTIVQMDNDTATVHNGSARVFGWSPNQQGLALAAFSYGFLVTQIPGGWLAQSVGGKWVYGVGVLMTSLITLFTPLAADVSVWLLVAVRVLEGLFEGVTYPAMFTMWGKWAPPLERTKLSTIGFAGSSVGNVISFPLSAVLSQYGFDGGWPSVFYVFGAVGIIWFVLWSFLAYSSPATHPRISREEREYIESSIAESADKKLPTPWLKIFTSSAVWAIFIANFCNEWGNSTLTTCMPTYFKQVLPQLQVNGEATVLSGVYSAVPSLVMIFVIPLSGQVADFMRSTRHFSTTFVRKIFGAAGGIGSATFLLLCAYLGTSTVTAVTFLTLSIAMTGVGIGGYHVNYLDIAPRFAGVIMGISNVIGTLPGLIAPQVAKAIAVEPNAPKGSKAYLSGYRDEWREVFIIGAEVYIFGALVYLILASGKKQPWADADGAVKGVKGQEGSGFRSLCNETEPSHVTVVVSGTAHVQKQFTPNNHSNQ